MILILALLFALVTPPDPQLIARQDGPGLATISWQQQTSACLSRVPLVGPRVLIACYAGSGRAVLRLGHAGPLDGAYRPAAGDVYLLEVDGQVTSAPLLPPIWLPLAKK